MTFEAGFGGRAGGGGLGPMIKKDRDQFQLKKKKHKEKQCHPYYLLKLIQYLYPHRCTLEAEETTTEKNNSV